MGSTLPNQLLLFSIFLNVYNLYIVNKYLNNQGPNSALKIGPEIIVKIKFNSLTSNIMLMGSMLGLLFKPLVG